MSTASTSPAWERLRPTAALPAERAAVQEDASSAPLAEFAPLWHSFCPWTPAQPHGFAKRWEADGCGSCWVDGWRDKHLGCFSSLALLEGVRGVWAGEDPNPDGTKRRAAGQSAHWQPPRRFRSLFFSLSLRLPARRISRPKQRPSGPFALARVDFEKRKQAGNSPRW